MRAKPTFSAFLAIALGLATLTSKAVEPTLAPAGFTGLGVTPNARLLGWGQAGFVYDNSLPGIAASPSGHNFVGGFGLLPNMEATLRLATSDIHSNCFTGCGAARDLSAAGKVAIGIDAANRFHVGAGVVDVGGGATYFRSMYGVLTYHEGPLEASAGLARRSGAGIAGSKSPLHGVFGSAAWQPLPWVRGHVEYTDSNVWAGVRLFAPQQWLPEGWSAYVGSNHRLTETNLTKRSWITAGMSIPLYKVPSLPGQSKGPLPPLAGSQERLPAYEARTPSIPVESGPATAASQARPALPQAAPLEDRHLHELVAALHAKGFEDISVGRMPDRSIAVRANNATYNWNSADALGVALGTVARTLAPTRAGYRLVMTQRQIPLVAVTGQADCLLQWIQNTDPSCTAGELSTPGTGPLEMLHQDAAWAVRNAHRSRETLRVSLAPVLRTTIGTEFGAYDYSIGANIGFALPLWDGATVEYRHNVALAKSEDFEATRVFGNRRVRSGVERLAVVQTVRLPVEQWFPPRNPADVSRLGLGAITAQASVGRFGMDYDGVHGMLRWEPGQGLHRLTAQAGWFNNHEFGNARDQFGPKTAKPLLASYRYAVMPTRTYLEATAGQFMNNDRGFQLGMRQWFSDVAVSAYYKRTQFGDSPARNLLGVELSLPLGPRKDMSPGRLVQVTGTPRFAHSVETSFREDVAGNPLRIGHGLLPPTPSLDATFNSDRAGLTYFEDNTRRIRDAAR
ncbi:YjbH domain-containing protein [Caenimonas sedimenti]|uniref:YjbH domain-containing protein n=1 Tax=Caenimonas sedimenti TaxID=2596921 RepID=A0A562ZVD3_9BURK|nr:YjbH domain-containing protein [Caenimonas sedimenti]TWO72288.1 YjbH domain-containing protein [Caenimonas sedimenti]